MQVFKLQKKYPQLEQQELVRRRGLPGCEQECRAKLTMTTVHSLHHRCTWCRPSSVFLRSQAKVNHSDCRHLRIPALYSSLDTEGKESVDRQQVIESLANQKVASYDQVRETLKDVQVDAT